MYVLDPGNHRVLIVDFRSGRILSQFGREGDGPFDFRTPHSIWVVPYTVFVLEGSRRSLVAFDATGQPLFARRMLIWEIGYQGLTRVGPDGWYFPVMRTEADSSTFSLLRVSGADTVAVYSSVVGREHIIQFDDCGTVTRVHVRPLET